MKIIDFHITCTCMRICSKSKTSVTFKPATNKQQAVKWLDWLNCADRYQILDCPIPPLIKHSDYKFDRFQLRVTHNLLYSMGNMDYADSQRQSSISLEVKHPQQTLKITIIFLLLLWTILWTWILILCFSLNFWQYLCRTFPIVDEHVKEAMGDSLYDLFMVCRKHLYNIDEWFYIWTVNRKQREILI